MTEHAAGGDVLDHGHRRQHAHQLEGAGHAFVGNPAGADAGDGIAVEFDFTGTRFQGAGDQVHHRGLAGAVRPDQAQDLFLGKVERHVLDRDQTAKTLGDRGSR